MGDPESRGLHVFLLKESFFSSEVIFKQEEGREREVSPVAFFLKRFSLLASVKKDNEVGWEKEMV